MILKNSLYKINNSERGEAGARYNIELDASHFIYQAHFPQEPITPGVCIVQIAKELLEDAIGKRLKLVKVKNVKFLSVLTPMQSVNAVFLLNKITVDEVGGCVKTQVTVTSAGEPKAKLSFTCSLL